MALGPQKASRLAGGSVYYTRAGSQAPAIAAEIRDLIEDIMIGVAEKLTLDLAEVNPIDTGHSHWNWVPGAGYRPTAIFGSKKAPTDSGQVAGLQELGSFTLKWGDGNIHVTNNVDYIDQEDDDGYPGLNAGYSPQASAGWVERVIDNVVEHANTLFRGLARATRR